MEQRATLGEERTHPGLILAVLSLSGAAYALLQSLVVPALPVLQDDLHTTTSGVAWVFTSYLLAASVATRFGIFEAGLASARDPKYTVVPQRERLRRREGASAKMTG